MCGRHQGLTQPRLLALLPTLPGPEPACGSYPAALRCDAHAVAALLSEAAAGQRPWVSPELQEVLAAAAGGTFVAGGGGGGSKAHKRRDPEAFRQARGGGAWHCIVLSCTASPALPGGSCCCSRGPAARLASVTQSWLTPLHTPPVPSAPVQRLAERFSCKRVVYENCRLYSMHGELLCHTGESAWCPGCWEARSARQPAKCADAACC